MIEEDCYYLTCLKGSNCSDSREMGYFTHKDIIGLYMEWPDRFKAKVINPILHYTNLAIDYALALLAPEEEPNKEGSKEVPNNNATSNE